MFSPYCVKTRFRVVHHQSSTTGTCGRESGGIYKKGHLAPLQLKKFRHTPIGKAWMIARRNGLVNLAKSLTPVLKMFLGRNTGVFCKHAKTLSTNGPTLVPIFLNSTIFGLLHVRDVFRCRNQLKKGVSVDPLIFPFTRLMRGYKGPLQQCLHSTNFWFIGSWVILFMVNGFSLGGVHLNGCMHQHLFRHWSCTLILPLILAPWFLFNQQERAPNLCFVI